MPRNPETFIEMDALDVKEVLTSLMSENVALDMAAMTQEALHDASVEEILTTITALINENTGKEEVLRGVAELMEKEALTTESTGKQCIKDIINQLLQASEEFYFSRAYFKEFPPNEEGEK